VVGCGTRYEGSDRIPGLWQGDLAQGDLWGGQGDDRLALFEEWERCVVHERGEISVRLSPLGCLERRR
jgi:hypothetical protein